MRPEHVGMLDSRVVLTARTGRHGLADRLQKLGYALSQRELDQAYQRFLVVRTRSRKCSTRISSPFSTTKSTHAGSLPARVHHIYSGTSAIPRRPCGCASETERAKARRLETAGGRHLQGISAVTGPRRGCRYEIRAVTSGTEAMAR